jgi:CRISPR-associated DxTHG motif protein
MDIEQDDAGAVGTHLLLTVLGLTPKLARYTLDGQASRMSLAPCALLELLPPVDRPDRIVALVTPQAETTSLPILRNALDGRYEIETVRVPDYDGSQDPRDYLDEFLRIAVGAVPREQGAQVTIDITHGLRHVSFLAYVAALYLGALRDVRVRGAYYAIFNREPADSPFLDLRPLLELPRWVHAATVIGETGSAEPISAILEVADHSGPTGQVTAALRRLTEAYLSGLPLELGWAVWQAGDLRKTLLRLLRDEHRLPLANELVDRISETVSGYRLPERAAGAGWKSTVALSREELDRQARLIDDLRRRGAVAQSLGLLREWTVSWAQWCSGASDDWTNRDNRRAAESALNALTVILDRPSLRSTMSGPQCDLASFWSELRRARNAYHHHGMRRQVVMSDDRDTRTSLLRVWRYWEATLCGCPDVPLRMPGPSGGLLLVSPVGARPGALFSAVHACREKVGEPTHCLLICSAQTESLAAQALACVGYTGTWTPVRLDDPYGGTAEINRRVDDHTATLVGADRVLINLTGGTTIMGLVAARMAEEARSFACTVRQFGVIDRRPPEEQRDDPYQRGEAFWLPEIDEESRR